MKTTARGSSKPIQSRAVAHNVANSTANNATNNTVTNTVNNAGRQTNDNNSSIGFDSPQSESFASLGPVSAIANGSRMLSPQNKSASVSSDAHILNSSGSIQLYTGVAVIQADGLISAVITGKETGDMSTDMIAKVIRSQLKKPDWETVIVAVLKAFDYQIGAPAVQGWISWAYSQLTGDFIKKILSWASPAYTAMVTANKVFHMLPEPLRNVILFAMARGMRAFLGKLSIVLSAENADWVVESLFVSDPSAAFDLVMEWLKGLVAAPASFLYAKYKEYMGGTKEATEGSSTTTGSTGGDSQETAVQERIDSLFSIDTSILKMNVGKPKLKKTKKNEDEGPNEESSSIQRRGGLTLPFTFSVHLFNKDLKANKAPNEITLPWAGGIDFSIPEAELTINAQLADAFHIGSIVLTNLYVTEKGLQSFGLAVRNLNIANNTVAFASLGGNWSVSEGTDLFGDGSINAMGHTFPININLGLDTDGKFKAAGLTISSLDKFEIIDGVFFLGSPKFEGSVATGGVIHLLFSGSPELKLGGMSIDGDTLAVAYDKKGSGKGSFEVKAESLNLKYGKLKLSVIRPRYNSNIKGLHADRASLSFKKSNEESPSEAGWLGKHSKDSGFNWTDLLKLAPQAEFSVPDVSLFKEAPYLKMGKPEVARLSMSMLGIDADLDFKNKKGSLKGEMGYSTKIPVLSLPIPIVPGLEAYVDIDVEAAIKGALAGSLDKPNVDKPPWHAMGTASLNGSVSATLGAGVQAGSQMVVAIAAGLYAKGTGEFKNEFSIQGGLQFIETRIRTVPEDPFNIAYKVGPVITASVGLQLKVKALHVFNKTLYQREFKKWTLGKYLLEGNVSWKNGKWETTAPKGAFESGKIAPPEHDDKTVSVQESRKLLLSAGVAIVDGAELRRELIQSIIDEYKKKDEDVYQQLDTYANELAGFKARRVALKKKFLSSIRYSSEIKELGKKIQQLEDVVETLRQNYREVLLVLIDVEKVIRSVAKKTLDLGEADLNTRLEQIYREGAKIDLYEGQKKEAVIEKESIKKSIEDSEKL